MSFQTFSAPLAVPLIPSPTGFGGQQNLFFGESPPPTGFFGHSPPGPFFGFDGNTNGSSLAFHDPPVSPFLLLSGFDGSPPTHEFVHPNPMMQIPTCFPMMMEQQSQGMDIGMPIRSTSIFIPAAPNVSQGVCWSSPMFIPPPPPQPMYTFTAAPTPAPVSTEVGNGVRICNFCKINGETKAFWTSHSTKDSRGRVCCPVLQQYKCPKCQATGKYSHTISYCPFLTSRERKMYLNGNRNRRVAAKATAKAFLEDRDEQNNDEEWDLSE